jgi:tripartite-type tricarboxylate transporter receptor subunit TctC
MRFLRRHFLQIAGAAVAASAAPRFAAALDYPTRPVRIVVGLPVGSAADTVARLLGQSLAERLGRAFIIENRPGAAGNIAAESVVNATADGYTLLFISTANAVNATLYENLQFNIDRDIAPVGGIDRMANVVVVNPSVPAKSVPEFIAYAKANPGKINMGSVGNGSAAHVAGELFEMMTGVNMLHVPYRGDVMPALLAGEVQVVFATLPPAIGYIRAGKLRALAVTTMARSEALPDVPTMTEFVPGYEASAWGGIGAPKRTPSEIVDKLNSEINTALGEPALKARLANFGSVPMPMAPGDFGKFIADETEKWAKVIKFADIKVE